MERVSNNRLNVYLCIGCTFVVLFFDPWFAPLPWSVGMYLACKESA